MIDATYAEGVDPSPYLDLPTHQSLDDFELDASKVCRIDDLSVNHVSKGENHVR